MARESEVRSPEVEALILRLEASRSGLGKRMVELRQRVDVPSRIRGSVRGKPWLWFGGSVAAGYVASRILRRPKRAARRNRWFGLMTTAAFALLKPMLKQVVTNELQKRFTASDSQKQPRFPLSKP